MNGIDQTILDRLTTLERRVRGIDIGQELVLGNLTALGTVRATDTQLKGPIADVRTFGASGAGYPIDDRSAIQAAIDAAYVGGKSVILPDPPGGHYYASEVPAADYPHALKIKPGVDISGMGINTQIRSYGNYAIFKPDPTVECNQFSIRNLKLQCEGIHTYPDTWTNAHGIWFPNEGYHTNQFIIENVVFASLYAGFFDESNAWGGRFINAWTDGSRYGFRKTGTGTTFVFIGCYAKGTEGAHYSGVHWDLAGWSFEAKIVGLNMIGCAMDDYVGHQIGLWRDQVGFLISGFDFEGNRATNPGGQAQMFAFTKSAHDLSGIIHGFTANASFIGEDAGETGDGTIMFLEGGQVSLESCTLGPNITNNKTGTVYSLQIEGTETSARSSRIKNMSQGSTGTIRCIGLTSGSQAEALTLDRCDYDAIYNPNNRKVFVIDEISVGAADSGGAGYKMLRVPNAADTTGA